MLHPDRLQPCAASITFQICSLRENGNECISQLSGWNLKRAGVVSMVDSLCVCKQS